MHCCLITAPTVTEFRSRRELMGEAVQRAATQPQLGILSVAAVMERAVGRPDIIDANSAYLDYAAASENLELDSFAEYLAQRAVRSNADLYGFSSICSTYPLSIRIAREVKKLRPYALVLFGGPQASVVDTGTIAAFPFVDFILRGEAEQTLPILLEALQRDYDYSVVAGLTYRDGAEVKRNASGPVIEDLDTIPPPAYHLSNYLRNASAASIELGRGCPFSCTFCSTNDFFRRKFRLRSPARVLADMRSIFQIYGITHFELVHDMFTVDRKRVVAFCEELLESRERFTWDCSARTDCVDGHLLELMKKSGCRSIFFGVETGSQRMQRVIDKDLDLARAREVLALCDELGLESTVSLITGFPEEEWDDVRGTVDVFTYAARHRHAHPQLNLLAPLAGTPIHLNHKKEMVLEELCSDMSHQGLSQSPQDLQLIRNFPDIFPNFYLIPVKALDRHVLFELREFLSMAVERFRWLLCSISQATDLLSFHQQWREWRKDTRGDLIGSELRRYYVDSQFPTDFIRFMRSHSLSENPTIHALVRAEKTLQEAAKARPPVPTECLAVSASEPLEMHDIPRRKDARRILKLHYKLDEVISAVATRTDPPRRKNIFYATTVDAKGKLHLVEISATLAAVITVCDGSPTVRDAVERLAQKLPAIDPALREFASERLLKGAQAAGFVDFYRPRSTADGIAAPAARQQRAIVDVGQSALNLS